MVSRVEAQFVDDHAGAARIFTGKERGAIGRTHGVTGSRVDKIDTCRGQPVHVWRLRLDIASKATRLIAQLVGKNIDQIVFTRSIRCCCPAARFRLLLPVGSV